MKVNFSTGKALDVSFTLSGSSSETQFHFDPLFQAIVPLESSFTTMSTKIEIKLKKEISGIKWNELEGSGDGEGVGVAMASVDAAKSVAHAYPSSAKKVRFNPFFFVCISPKGS